MKMADLIRSLHEAGASIEVIIAAAERFDAAEEERLAKGRKRTADWRARNVTQHHVTSPPLSPKVALSPYNPLTHPNPHTPSEPNGSVSERGSDARKRVRKSYPEAFERLWKAYPTDQNMSKAEALTAWSRLPGEERELVEASVPGFVAYCQKNPDYRPVHLNRYIAKQRYHGHLEAAKVVNARTTIQPADPEWQLWRTHYRDMRQNGMVKLMDTRAAEGRGFTVPNKTPPGHSTAA